MGVPSVRSAGQVPGDTPWARARVFGQSGGSLVGSVWRGEWGGEFEKQLQASLSRACD